MAVGNRALGGFTDVLVVPVGHKALQAADAHRFPFDAPDTFGLTLGFLGADTAAHSGQGALLGDDLVGALKVPLGHLFNEIRDVDANRAAGHTGLVLAGEAALGLVQRLLFGVAQGHL